MQLLIIMMCHGSPPILPNVTFLAFLSLFIDRKIEKEQDMMCRRRGKESVKECDSLKYINVTISDSIASSKPHTLGTKTLFSQPIYRCN